MWTWKPDGLIKVLFILKTNHTAGELFHAVKDSLKDKIYMYLGNGIVYIYEDTAIGGNLDVGTTQATTSINAYVNRAGHQGNVEMEPGWNTQGYINFNTTASDGLFFTATKDVIYMYCGLIIVYFLQTNNKCLR